MENYNYLKTEFIERSIFKITLNRPDKFNAFVRPMALELQHALDFSNNENNIRCVLLTGEGKAFCAGQDLSEAVENNGIDISQIVLEHYNPIILKMRNHKKPVVCAVKGVAAGAGANIALAADITVASQSATFIQAFSKIGLIPDSGGTYILPRLIGYQKAAGLMFTGDKISAADAEKMGMIFQCYADEVFEEEVLKLARKLSEMPTKALEYTKRLLNISHTNTLENQLSAECDYQVKSTLTHDFNEGVSAFLQKRKPEFKGN